MEIINPFDCANDNSRTCSSDVFEPSNYCYDEDYGGGGGPCLLCALFSVGGKTV